MARTHRSYRLDHEIYLRVGMSTGTVAGKMIRILRGRVTPESGYQLDLQTLPRKARKYDDRMTILGTAEDYGSGIKYSIFIKHGARSVYRNRSEPVCDLEELHEWLTWRVTFHD